jgi:hypothetical protein
MHVRQSPVTSCCFIVVVLMMRKGRSPSWTGPVAAGVAVFCGANLALGLSSLANLGDAAANTLANPLSNSGIGQLDHRRNVVPRGPNQCVYLMECTTQLALIVTAHSPPPRLRNVTAASQNLQGRRPFRIPGALRPNGIAIALTWACDILTGTHALNGSR